MGLSTQILPDLLPVILLFYVNTRHIKRLKVQADPLLALSQCFALIAQVLGHDSSHNSLFLGSQTGLVTKK
jgi:hypothetical protein